MNLYLISQSANRRYDTYDSAVIAAKDEQDARLTHARHGPLPADHKHWTYYYSTWCKPGDVTVELIGEAVEGTKAGVICASFNAG